MADTSVTKVQSEHSPRGRMGQKYLASGLNTALRLWDKEPPGDSKEISARDYETVGFVLAGRAELEIESQKILLEPGDSWVVPKNALHRYTIQEEFTAVEATSPPAFAHARDETGIVVKCVK